MAVSWREGERAADVLSLLQRAQPKHWQHAQQLPPVHRFRRALITTFARSPFVPWPGIGHKHTHSQNKWHWSVVGNRILLPNPHMHHFDAFDLKTLLTTYTASSHRAPRAGRQQPCRTEQACARPFGREHGRAAYRHLVLVPRLHLTLHDAQIRSQVRNGTAHGLEDGRNRSTIVTIFQVRWLIIVTRKFAWSDAFLHTLPWRADDAARPELMALILMRHVGSGGPCTHSHCPTWAKWCQSKKKWPTFRGTFTFLKMKFCQMDRWGMKRFYYIN